MVEFSSKLGLQEKSNRQNLVEMKKKMSEKGKRVREAELFSAQGIEQCNLPGKGKYHHQSAATA
jgi:hypothetical protein